MFEKTIFLLSALMILPFLTISLFAAKAVYKKATFAGGCFWCMESPFEKQEGVIEVLSGYTGGKMDNPTYHDVSSGRTEHLEAIQVTFDPSKISYSEILDVFWRQIDPTDQGGQFVDRGNQYTTAIFFHDDEQKQLAEESKTRLSTSKRFKKSIVTKILKASTFYPAEDYHQDFYKKSPDRYINYRTHSGRDNFLKMIWGNESTAEKSDIKERNYPKMSDQEIKAELTPLQYNVTQKNGTEQPFANEYWDNKEDGIYVDIVSGEPLFISLDKFKSGTGWPSFTKPLVEKNIKEVQDETYGMVRTEVRSRHGDSHLGHLFTDGPAPTGLRYCINSASLRFIPKGELEKEGYGKFKEYFK